MKQNRKTNLLTAGAILLAVLVCGVIGYLNRSGQASAASPNAGPAALAAGKLGYCTGPTGLCVVSFGRDSANNLLVILKDEDPAANELYVRIEQAGQWALYACQKVKITPAAFYCLGSAIPEGATITMEVYLRDKDVLLASGELPVHAALILSIPTPFDLANSAYPNPYP